MIKICYPPGCYGSYMSRCIYNYSDLREEELDLFQFDKFGSSHSHRDDTKVSNSIQNNHFNNGISFDHLDNTLVILPGPAHMLDYFNNSIMKEIQDQNFNLTLQQLKIFFNLDEIGYKLQQGWNYKHGLNNKTPQWILREFISFWIEDCFNNGYDIQTYQTVPHKIHITTQDIFLDFLNTIFKIFKVFNLPVTVSESVIANNHLKFLHAQKYHQSQIHCEQWCHDILERKHSLTPCNTIFDEAYVQHYLRKQGFELQCDGLNAFPTTSTELIKIIYKT